MYLWIAIKSKLASYIYRHCVVALYRFIHFWDQLINEWLVRSFAVRSSTGISKGSLNMETNSNKIENTLQATKL